MKKEIKLKILKVALTILGLVLVFCLGKGLSSIMYKTMPGPDQNPSGQADAASAAPKPALTKAQIEELFRSMKAAMGAKGDAPNGTGASQEPGGTGGNTGGGNGDSTEGTAGSPGEDDEASGLPLLNGELDFNALWEINEDIYAWITIPGTNIDYPILQHPTDDSYYLNYNIDGSYGHPGCIYTENLNSKKFTDPNTVIYGHNLKEKTMFTELHKFESRDFFEEHNEIIIYLPEKTLRYRVFAAHVYDDRHLMYSFDFSDKEIYANYLQSIYDIRDMSANIDRENTVTAEDKIITLVTCMPQKADAAKRLLVQAVLTGED